MERVLSVEEKIRRAEEIYERKRQGGNRTVAKVSVNNNKKDLKLLKKMLIQIIACTAIYLTIYTINNNQYVFSKDFTNKVNDILSYDTNFIELYNNVQNNLKQLIKKDEEIHQEESIGGAEETISNNQEESVTNVENNSQGENNTIDKDSTDDESKEIFNNEQNIVQENNIQQLSQEEQDILAIKNTTSFIKPVDGKISSKFGRRETATGNVPKNHTGTDIAANLGTKIKSSTDGEVVLASEQGDFRKAFKNSNRGSKHYLCTL